MFIAAGGGGDELIAPPNFDPRAVDRLEVHGNRDRWTLVMLPSDTKLAELMLEEAS